METVIFRMCGTQTECHLHIHYFFLAFLISFILSSRFTLNSSRNNEFIIIYFQILFLVHFVSCLAYLMSVLITSNGTEFQDGSDSAIIKRDNPLQHSEELATGLSTVSYWPQSKGQVCVALRGTLTFFHVCEIKPSISMAKSAFNKNKNFHPKI